MIGPMSTVEERTLEDLAASRADAAERVRNQQSFAEKGLGALTVANGGALIGLFTFIGNAVGKHTAIRFDLSHLWLAFGAFCVGVALTLIAYLLAFWSQVHFYRQAMHEVERFHRSLAFPDRAVDQTAENKANSSGQKAYGVAFFAALLALAAFVAGCGLALAGVLPG